MQSEKNIFFCEFEEFQIHRCLSFHHELLGTNLSILTGQEKKKKKRTVPLALVPVDT